MLLCRNLHRFSTRKSIAFTTFHTVEKYSSLSTDTEVWWLKHSSNALFQVPKMIGLGRAQVKTNNGKSTAMGLITPD
jgi:hypothetical protein